MQSQDCHDHAEGATLLVVDDEPVNLTTVAGLLQQHGHNLLIANSGEKALSVINEKQPDLILLDMQMPGLSGIEVCGQIKADPTTHIPILFLTACSDDIEEGFNAGGVDYILKPFREVELIARVNTHLKMSRLTRSLESELFDALSGEGKDKS